MMHVISKSAWREVVAAEPSLEAPTAAWYKIATHAQWESIVDVRRVYPHADYVEPYTIFNLKGNAYRLVVKIEYRRSLIFIRGLFTHAEYSRGGWKQ